MPPDLHSIVTTHLRPYIRLTYRLLLPVYCVHTDIQSLTPVSWLDLHTPLPILLLMLPSIYLLAITAGTNADLVSIYPPPPPDTSSAPEHPIPAPNPTRGGNANSNTGTDKTLHQDGEHIGAGAIAAASASAIAVAEPKIEQAAEPGFAPGKLYFSQCSSRSDDGSCVYF
jgi:hypothetical protein